jgi:NADPH:quinone reductase-like Zn-dependent oxidoreductase
MNAAVVTSFDTRPRYASFADPAGETVVDVAAAALHPRVRSMADGSHYESTGELPLIPGIDGVGRDAEGSLRYFVLPDTALGSMAERVAIDPRRSALLPPHVDPVTIAAVMNPAMSSWIALRRRIDFTPGQSVLVLGASGSAGRMAVQIARHLGAAEVIGAARDPAKIANVDRALSLDGVAQAADVDVVIDYLWGESTRRTLPEVLTNRSDRGRPLTWIEIGSVAGLELTLPSAWLRAARLQLVGSGQGSVSTHAIVEELPALAEHITANDYVIDARPTPLADVETTWNEVTSDRLVYVPF